MRVRNAVGIVSGIVAAKAALTWLALLAWGSLPERPGFVGHWLIQLGPLSEWVGALFTAGAVAVALWVAGHETRARRRERDDADHAQARLVVVDMKKRSYDEWFEVTIRNYGERPIIDVRVVHAWWLGHADDVTWRYPPAYAWSGPHVIRIVQPERERPSRPAELTIQLLDRDGELVPKMLKRDEIYRDSSVYEDIPGDPDAEIVFMDANGNHWQTGTSKKATRYKPPST